MAQGLPQAGDRGLDRTRTWGRTYWGGALFCLLADIDIRRRTDNRYGLADALRAIMNATGGMESTRLLRDAAVGVPVLTELYDAMRETAVATDLPALWQRLGISVDGDTVQFDDNAPLAAIRRAMTAP